MTAAPHNVLLMKDTNHRQNSAPRHPRSHKGYQAILLAKKSLFQIQSQQQFTPKVRHPKKHDARCGNGVFRTNTNIPHEVSECVARVRFSIVTYIRLGSIALADSPDINQLFAWGYPVQSLALLHLLFLLARGRQNVPYKSLRYSVQLVLCKMAGLHLQRILFAKSVNALLGDLQVLFVRFPVYRQFAYKSAISIPQLRTKIRVRRENHDMIL